MNSKNEELKDRKIEERKKGRLKKNDRI